MSPEKQAWPKEVVRKLNFIYSVKEAIILARKEEMSFEEIIGVLTVIATSETIQARLDFEKLSAKINN